MISKRAFIQRVATTYLLTKIARRLDGKDLPPIDSFSADSLAEEMGGIFFQLATKLPLYSQNEGKLVGQLDQQGTLDPKIIGRLHAQITKDDLIRAISGLYDDDELNDYLSENRKLKDHVQELRSAKAGPSFSKISELTNQISSDESELSLLKKRLLTLSMSSLRDHPSEIARKKRELGRLLSALEGRIKSNQKLVGRIQSSIPTEVSVLKTSVLPTLAQRNFVSVFNTKMEEKQNQYKGFGDNLRKRLETPLKVLVEDFFAKNPLLSSILDTAKNKALRAYLDNQIEDLAREIEERTSLNGNRSLPARKVNEILNSYFLRASDLVEELREATFNDFDTTRFVDTFKNDSSSNEEVDQALVNLIERGRGSYLHSIEDRVDDLILEILQNRLKLSLKDYDSESEVRAKEINQIIRNYLGSSNARSELYSDWEIDDTFQKSFLDYVVNHIEEEESLSKEERRYTYDRVTEIFDESESKSRPLIDGVDERDLMRPKDQLAWFRDSDYDEEEEEY